MLFIASLWFKVGALGSCSCGMRVPTITAGLSGVVLFFEYCSTPTLRLLVDSIILL